MPRHARIHESASLGVINIDGRRVTIVVVVDGKQTTSLTAEAGAAEWAAHSVRMPAEPCQVVRGTGSQGQEALGQRLYPATLQLCHRLAIPPIFLTTPQPQSRV